MTDYIAPTRGGEAFNCPSCGAFAHQIWGSLHLTTDSKSFRRFEREDVGFCARCAEPSVWVDGQMVFPAISEGPLPNLDMPEELKADYEEARAILARSPRGASALLRLVVQKLCAALGEPGKNINDDIAALVKKGLLPQVQQALDAVRVIGNNAVHPGQIDLKDDQATALSLFVAVNLIVEQMITAPKHAAALYSSLPETQRVAIEQRDS